MFPDFLTSFSFCPLDIYGLNLENCCTIMLHIQWYALVLATRCQMHSTIYVEPNTVGCKQLHISEKKQNIY